jgi:hypothetical protein
VTPSQIFRKDPGHNGQFRWHILNPDGSDTGQCLDREHCHHGSSNLRMASCDHCGAYHWQYDGSKFAEDHWKNCIQSTGAVNHCSQSHAPIKWPVEANCKVKSQTISNVQCKNKNSGGTCGADFQQGSTVGAHSTHDCNACKAAAGSTLQCNFAMGISVTHTYTAEFSSATSVGVKMGLEFEAGLIFASAKTSFEVSVDETITVGHSTSSTKSYNVQSACDATIKAGSRESATANFFSGTVVGDFTADVTTTWDCPWKPVHKESTTGTMTITNVPTQTVEGSCTPVNESCNKLEPAINFLV